MMYRMKLTVSAVVLLVLSGLVYYHAMEGTIADVV